eukprot:EG_transcript_17052
MLLLCLLLWSIFSFFPQLHSKAPRSLQQIRPYCHLAPQQWNESSAPVMLPAHCPNVARQHRAILYLAGKKRLGELKQSLSMTFQNFNDAYRYPVIIFHDALNETDARCQLSAVLSEGQLCLVKFIHVEFHFPPHLNQPPVVDRARFPGYQHMCDFWFRGVFQIPEVQGLEYYLRLDTDSFLLAPIKYDLFEYFHRRRLKYGFRRATADSLKTTLGLWQCLGDFARARGLRPRLRRLLPAGPAMAHTPVPMYYNNFEVLHVPLMARPDVREFVDAVYHSLGQYVLRWGDAPLRYLLVQLFLDTRTEVRECCDISYKHQRTFQPTCAPPT